MTKQFALTTENGKLTCPELKGYELPEWNHQEDDVEVMAKEATKKYINEREKQTAFLEYIDGYRKAREKFEFTEDDMVQAFAYGKTLEPFDSFDDFISNIRKIRTARTPIAIEVEMVRVWNGDCFDLPATNPDGTVKVVNWIFNE